MFLADSRGLDFLNSLASPGGTPVEWLSNGEDLLDWLLQAGLVPADTAAWMRTNALPGELDGAAAQARELREWFRGFVDAHRGKPLSADAMAGLSRLNALLERDELYRVIAPAAAAHDGAVFERRATRRWRSPASLLLPIADALADVVCAADFAQVKHCEGHDCTLMFLDTTQGRARRWCSMAACGNRAKQAAHRERMKQQRAARAA